MTGAYNVAIRYLCDKYKASLITPNFVTDKGIELYSNDHRMVVLVKQYNCLSVVPKKELEELLSQMEIPFEKRCT